ncbi:MAG: hypothetical protein LBS47_01375 [Endomicrobium sp.]|nr:hypothetical protein [Endomicrobium sp.]
MKIKIPKRYKSIIYKIYVMLKDNKFDAYIVGGFVRDLFIGRDPKDLDIVVCTKKTDKDRQLSGINFAKNLAKRYKLREPIVFEKFGTARLLIDGEVVEFVMPRKEEYCDLNSRNPVTQLASLEEDALRRDFTINALFLRIIDLKVLDFTSRGLDDIKNKIIRVTNTSNAKIIFHQDPLRILRAIRQSLQLGFVIENDTYNAMRISFQRIRIVSHERIRDELNKILLEQAPSKAFVVMDRINLLTEILPEIARLKKIKLPFNLIDDAFVHTLEVLDRTKSILVLRMAALLHSVVEYGVCEKTENILERFKYSKKFIRKTISIIQNYACFKMCSGDLTDVAIHRFIKRCGEEFDLIMEFSKAYYGKDSNDKKFVKIKNRIDKIKLKNMLYSGVQLFSGNDLMKIFNKSTGKWIKDVKNQIEEMQIENPYLTKEEAIKALKISKNLL